MFTSFSFFIFNCILKGIPDQHGIPIEPQTQDAGLQSIPIPIPIQTPPNCESPYRYPTIYTQPHNQHLIQTPVPSIHHSSSAFCAIPPQAHHDPSGK